MNAESTQIKLNIAFFIFLFYGLVGLAGLSYFSVFLVFALEIKQMDNIYSKIYWKGIIIVTVMFIFFENISQIFAVIFGINEVNYLGYLNEFIENNRIIKVYNIIASLSLLFALYLFSGKDVKAACEESNGPKWDVYEK